MGWWTALFTQDSLSEHPGENALTEYALSFCTFNRNSLIVDVGCGKGGSVALLRRKLGCRVIGVDRSADAADADILRGDAEALPFENALADGVLTDAEKRSGCMLVDLGAETTTVLVSQISCPEKVLHECARILKAGGTLLLTDLYSRTDEVRQSNLGCLFTKETLRSALCAAGFSVTYFEDVSPLLTQLWASAMLSGSGDGACRILRLFRESGAKPGYYILTATRL